MACNPAFSCVAFSRFFSSLSSFFPFRDPPVMVRAGNERSPSRLSDDDGPVSSEEEEEEEEAETTAMSLKAQSTHSPGNDSCRGFRGHP